ncbi:MAG: cytochrome c oxidase subunit II [Bacteroidetes bacterium]|nr:cytochrome c oxidase subunit II [Bacteroidota bacterium]
MILLYIVAFILLCIACNQLFKVFELSRDLRGEPLYKVTDSDNQFSGRTFLLFGIVFFGFFFWQLIEWGHKLLPKSASEHGEKIDALMNANWAIVITVFLVVNGLLFFFAWKYRGRKDHKASYISHNNKLEMIWTVIPAIALAFIIIFGLKYWNEIMKKGSDPNPVKIELYAKQFDWTARYAGKDNEFGIDNYLQISGANSVGLDTNDARCNDDILVKNEFHIPIGRDVEFQFRSRDVIHSALMPHFRAQMNCVPGQVTSFRFKPTITTVDMRKDPQVIRNIEEINALRAKRGDDPIEFDYLLLCNKVCGASHYNMQMKIVVESEADYNAWLAKQKTFKQVASK